MCGFIGYISDIRDSQNQIYQKKFSEYLLKLNNRGPDYTEEQKIYYKNKIIHVGFSRLAIQDLKSSSNKIFYNNNSLILFNGEIYNFNELKKNYFLNDKFDTKTDTELLFKLFEKYGPNITSKLKGIFSIVFINLKKGEIYLIRDFTGTKPLYYYKKMNNFFFCSEAWFLYSLSEKKINYDSLNYFFNFGFAKETNTLIKDVKKIAPRSILNLSLENMNLKNSFYFDLEKQKSNKLPEQEEINPLVENVIKSNLISDAKVGTFLSGGVDSTTVTLTAKKFNKDLEAFTTYFLPEKKFQKFNIDFDYANRVAKDFDIKLNVHYVENENDFYNDFLKITNYLDEPVSNLNFLNTYWQTKHAKEKGFKVILTGDGADELFCGYDRYHRAITASKLNFLSFFSKKIKKYTQLTPNKIPLMFYSIFKKNENFQILKNKIDKEKLFLINYYENFEFDNIVDYINYFDIRYWLTNENNYKLDKCSMINSIEARVPFQDIELIKKMFFIKNESKFSFINRKFLLKKNNILPKYVVKRSKNGWFSPEKIFLDVNLNKIIKEYFSEKNIKDQDIFDYKNLINFFNSYSTKGYLIKREILTIILFQIWYNRVLALK